MFTTPLCRQAATASSHAGDHFQLRFASLFHTGHSLTFPCDASGRVTLDRLTERSRNNYFFARVVVGRDDAWPVVEPALHRSPRPYPRGDSHRHCPRQPSPSARV